MATRFYVAGWLLSVVCLTQGCNRQQPTGKSGAAWTVIDSWYHPAPSSSPIGDTKESVEAAFYEVTDVGESQAEALLRHKASVSLSPQQATKLTRGRYKAASGKLPYLVRSVYLNRETGGFVVSRQGKKLFVQHESLGHHAVPMKRKALVVLLASAPTEVFVSCGMDE